MSPFEQYEQPDQMYSMIFRRLLLWANVHPKAEDILFPNQSARVKAYRIHSPLSRVYPEHNSGYYDILLFALIHLPVIMLYHNPLELTTLSLLNAKLHRLIYMVSIIIFDKTSIIIA